MAETLVTSLTLTVQLTLLPHQYQLHSLVLLWLGEYQPNLKIQNIQAHALVENTGDNR